MRFNKAKEVIPTGSVCTLCPYNANLGSYKQHCHFLKIHLCLQSHLRKHMVWTIYTMLTSLAQRYKIWLPVINLSRFSKYVINVNPLANQLLEKYTLNQTLTTGNTYLKYRDIYIKHYYLG